MTGTKKNEYQS